MEPVNLCPRPQVEYPAPETESKTYALDDLSTAHQCKHQPYQTDRDGTECRLCRRKAPESRDALEIDAEQLFFDGTLMRREKDITNENSLGGDQATLLGPLLLTLRSHSLVQDLGLSHRPTSAYHTLTSLIPLDKCILDIIWEVLDQSSNLSKLSLFDRGWEGSLENFVVLLRSAALYQAGLESVSPPMPYPFIEQNRDLTYIGSPSVDRTVAHLSSSIYGCHAGPTRWIFRWTSPF